MEEDSVPPFHFEWMICCASARFLLCIRPRRLKPGKFNPAGEVE